MTKKYILIYTYHESWSCRHGGWTLHTKVKFFDTDIKMNERAEQLINQEDREDSFI